MYKQSTFSVDCFYMIKNFLHELMEKRLTTVAGAWVFYFLTSVIPLVFLIITAFGVFGVDITLDLVSRLPLEFRSAGEAIVSTAKIASKGTTVLFIFTAIFSCAGLLNQMSKDGDFLYGARSKVKRGVMRRIMAIFSLASFFIVFLSCAILVAFGNQFFNLDKLFNMPKGLLATVLTFFAVILISYFIIILLNKFISPIKLKFSQIAVGGFCSLVIVVLGTIGFALYLRFFNSYNAFYGSLAGIIVFLFWAYILMVGLVAGVIVNVKIYNLKIKDLKEKKKLSRKNEINTKKINQNA